MGYQRLKLPYNQRKSKERDYDGIYLFPFKYCERVTKHVGNQLRQFHQLHAFLVSNALF